MISQIKEIKSEIAFKSTIENSKKPLGYKCITVDTGQTLESYIQDVMNYIYE